MAQKETRPKNVPPSGQLASPSPPVARAEHHKLQTQVTNHASAAQLEHASKWAVMAIIAIGVFMATLDTSIVNISLPVIAQSFGVPLNGAIEWVIIAYLVVIAGVLLTTGRLADMLGHKPIWAAGLTIFTIGSAFCGFAPSLLLLIAARALQGIGGALIMAISPAMLTSAFPASERGRALGLNAVVVALGVSTGPTLGGVITTYLSWRWIFFVNIPIGIILIRARRIGSHAPPAQAGPRS